MKKNRALIFPSLLPSLLLLAASQNQALATNATGFVTPTALIITFTSLSLITADNKQKTLLTGSYPTTFRRADSDFASVSLAGVTVPQGRYVGVNLCYNTDRTVVLNGVKYQGVGGGGLVDNTTLIYSIGSSSLAPNSIGTSAPSGGATSMPGDIVGNGTNNCSISYFNNSVCVSSSGSGCNSTDTVVDPSALPPNISVVMDLYHSVGIDNSNLSIDNHVPAYPYPSIGRPGAAVHLAASPGAGVYGDMTLLFDSSKRLMYSSANTNGSVPGTCTGVGAVAVTAGPAGAFINSYGPTWVMAVNTTSGQVQFVGGNCGTGGTCTSGGMNQISNFNQAAGQTTAVTCVADSAATPANLGFTYTGAGSPVMPGPTTYTVARVVDPSNIFGKCASASGSCSTATGDGYP